MNWKYINLSDGKLICFRKYIDVPGWKFTFIRKHTNAPYGKLICMKKYINLFGGKLIFIRKDIIAVHA
jgi:hypothetical protein